MTTADLQRAHHEANHPCDVAGGPAGTVAVRCRHCGGEMQATLVSPCVGGRHDSRLILMLRCVACGATGQLRLAKPAPWENVPPVPPMPTATVDVLAGGPGYVNLRCSCGGAGTMYVTSQELVEDVLVLRGVVHGCGHPVELRLPACDAFAVESHLHG